jgi:hypothetical protein
VDGRPDALMIPATMKRGATPGIRLDMICTLAEGFLGLDRRKGEHARVRVWPPKGEFLFVTTSDLDEFYFPQIHPKAGQSRYRWEMQPNGIAFGYFEPGAIDARQQVTAPETLARFLTDRMGIKF